MHERTIRGIIPAMVTPFDTQLKLNTSVVPQLVDSFLKAHCSGIFVGGATSEPTTMTISERKIMTEAVISEVGGVIPVIVHVGATDIESAIDLAKHAEKTGATAIATLPPLERGSLDVDINYYKDVGSATNLPFYVYWRSDMAKQPITPERFLDKMAVVPNFVGLKFTDSNLYFLQRLITLSNNKLNCLTGNDDMFTASLAMGCHGAIGTTYNYMPNHYVKMYEDFHSGNIQGAIQKQAQANELISLLIQYGVISGTKALLENRGIPVGTTRPNNTFNWSGQILPNQLRQMQLLVDKYDLR